MKRLARWSVFLLLIVGILLALVNMAEKADRQQAAGQQEAGEGPVTVYTMDGNAWGYYGTLHVITHDDGTVEVVLEDAWLVGTTDKTFLEGSGAE